MPAAYLGELVDWTVFVHECVFVCASLGVRVSVGLFVCLLFWLSRNVYAIVFASVSLSVFMCMCLVVGAEACEGPRRDWPCGKHEQRQCYGCKEGLYARVRACV